jgi:hypothetical protein
LVKRFMTMLVKTHFVVLVAACLAGAVALACSSDPPGTAGTTSGGFPPVDGGSSGTDGGSSGSDGGSSSGGEGGVPLDSGGPPPTGECAGLTKDGATITHQQVAQAAPSPTGGSIVAGKYILTAYTTYTGVGGATGPTTERLNSTLTVTSTMMKLAEADEDGDLTPQAMTYTTTGTTLEMKFLCPVPDALRFREYTAQPTALWIFQGGLVRIYTKQ